MSELREKDLRWQIAFEITTGDLDGKSSGEIADNILALLPSPAMSGVEALDKDGNARELTEHEASEALKNHVEVYNKFNSSMYTSTGETLRRKKEAQ